MILDIPIGYLNGKLVVFGKSQAKCCFIHTYLLKNIGVSQMRCNGRYKSLRFGFRARALCEVQNLAPSLSHYGLTHTISMISLNIESTPESQPDSCFDRTDRSNYKMLVQHKFDSSSGARVRRICCRRLDIGCTCSKPYHDMRIAGMYAWL